MKFSNYTPFLFLLLATACDVSHETDQVLRTGEVDCPPGCVCTCEPLGTSTGSTSSDTDVSSDTGALLDVGTPDMGSGSSSTGEVEQFPDGAGPNNDYIHELMGRRYRYRYPDTWDGVTPLRPLFFFHAHGSNGVTDSYYDSFRYSNNGGYLVVTLEGGLPSYGGQYARWNTSPDDPFSDVPFAQAVIEGVESLPYVDASRRFLGGMSGGAFMANSVACHVGADAIVVGSGGIAYLDGNEPFGGQPDPASCVQPVRVFIHHGRQDAVGSSNGVTFDNGEAARDFWASANGCTSSTPVDVPLPGLSTSWCEGYPPEPCSCVEYTCTDGAVTWCEDEGEHTWYPEHKRLATKRVGGTYGVLDGWFPQSF